MKRSFKTVWLECPRCGFSEPREIPLGTTLNATECPDCGEEMGETDCSAPVE